jgi:hypothetical protein
MSGGVEPGSAGNGRIGGNRRIGGRNPVRTGYSAIADEWIGIRPGTDGLCLNRIGKLPRERPIGYRDARN